MASRFRNIYKFLVPSWLSQDDGDKVLYSLALIKDAAVERLRQGLEARMPTRASLSANELSGKSRGIPRGRSETNEHYAARLLRWRWPGGHRVRGSAWALLEQISEYFGGVKISSIDTTGRRHVRTADGTESITSDPGDWLNWGSSARWWRFWLFFEPNTEISVEPQPDFGDPALWGGAIGTPGYSIGQVGLSVDDADGVKRLLRAPIPWRPEHTYGEWLVLSFGVDDILPSPSSSWVHWSENVGGTQQATRDPSFRYWSLSPEINNTYAGDPTNFPEASDNVDGSGEYGGDPTSFPSSVVLPSGKVYVGDPTKFPASARLVDDGDAP